MSKVLGMMMVVAASVFIGLSGLLLSGCGGSDNDGGDGDDGGGVTPPPAVSYDGPFVDGSSSIDGGEEEYAYVGPMGVRLDVNDISKHDCVPGFYFLDGSIVESQGALTWTTVNGALVFTASSFTSPRSGAKYRFMGWTVESSSNPLVTENPLTITDPSGTLRVYWATVQ